MLYISTSVLVLCTPNAGRNSHFQRGGGVWGRIKHSTSVWMLTQKTRFFVQFYSNLLLFCVFQLFSTKNAENYYFDQCLGCTSPKRWLKYTTHVTNLFIFSSLDVHSFSVMLPFSLFRFPFCDDDILFLKFHRKRQNVIVNFHQTMPEKKLLNSEIMGVTKTP